MKRLLILVLSFVMAMTTFSGCLGENTDSSIESSSGEGHVHVFDETWKTAASYHWRECECGEKGEISLHVGEPTSCLEKPICEVCGVEFGTPGDHVGSTPTCTQKSQCEVCGEEFGEFADHVYGEIKDVGGVLGYTCTSCTKTLPLLSEEKNGEFVEGLVDFVVEVDEGKNPIVLQLSDPQICNWGNVENMCYSYIRETVEATDPDLILITGDVVYGKFDEDGQVLVDFIEFMESLQIPWAPVFGNHDNECALGVDWQCQQFENAQYCLFEQRNLSGNGNYSVGILQGGELLRTFYMLDSNGCGAPSNASISGQNGIRSFAGFGVSQENWYRASIKRLKAIAPDVKISFAFHIQPYVFLDAFQKYEEYDGMTTSGTILQNPLNLDRMKNAEETDFGYLGRGMKGPWDSGDMTIDGLKELGIDSIFVGHEHCNSASIVYEGIRFQYGQKSSTYDRYNWVLENGVSIQGDYMDKMPTSARPLMGGTVIPLSQEDGSITKPYIYLCGDPLGLNP